jgi:hypothetical protein
MTNKGSSFALHGTFGENKNIIVNKKEFAFVGYVNVLLVELLFYAKLFVSLLVLICGILFLLVHFSFE